MSEGAVLENQPEGKEPPGRLWQGKAFLTCSHSEGRNVKNLCPLLKKRLVIWKLGCEGMFLQDRFPLLGISLYKKSKSKS